ncbi:lantibiotic dehydratase C-terminal domain-containing protein [Streptomyces sp. TLI_171]|uniref:lantibiotic dehydratase C-terminal domain-containing protein n=1 Tax=Streptomyces sp. TLI_171 TaxID=1938859 RepID=UPI000C191AAE|nr:lantibiotic dehydratase C-terminal domain-containing protein [Streptomyces sp. TLI_171]RKE17125.1 lantibiotic biosynthesis dehydratase-like protein [Streptomyces sp. TLI_171]
MTGAHDVVLTYYQPVKARALREAVLPVARDAVAAGLGAHVERHWRFGPHLRLRLSGPADPAARAAADAADRLRQWAAAHPSVADRSDRQLLDEAAVAGRAELIAPPYGPLHPDNTVRVAPVDPAATAALQALLGVESAALREELLQLGLPALSSGCAYLGAHGDREQARVQLAVVALAAHAAAHPDGLIGAHYSYLSHLEDFLLHEDPDGRLRAAFDRAWDGIGDSVTALVGRITGGGARGFERDWAHWSVTAWQRAGQLHAAGADLGGSRAEYRDRAAALGDPATANRWDPERRLRYSEFHRLLHRSDPTGTMWTRPDYLIHRAATNGLYRLLAVCDLRPVERYLAAHLVVRTVPALTGHRWQDRVAEVIETVEAGR